MNYVLIGQTSDLQFAPSDSIGVLSRPSIDYKTSIEVNNLDTTISYQINSEIRQEDFSINIFENVVLSKVRQILEEN